MLAQYFPLRLDPDLDARAMFALAAANNRLAEVLERLMPAPAAEQVPAKRHRARGNPRPADVVAAAVEVIRQRGRPMSRREIHAELARRGLEVRGANPIKALGVTLWRSDALMQIEGRGYWVAADPIPSAA